MGEKQKTKVQPLEELAALRQEVADLKAIESDHRRTQEALRAAKEYAETLIASSLDMIIAVDENRRIVEFNRAAELSFGYRREEVLGRSIDLLYADPAQSCHVHTAISRNGQFTGEVTNRRKNGELFCSYLSASVMRNGNGRLLGFMGISRDISDRKMLERQHAQFLSLLTHDIKKPLGTILICAELVLDEVSKRELTGEADLLEKLRGNVLTIDTLVSNYLYFSKIEGGQLTLAKMPIAIGRVLRKVEQYYEAEARRKHIALEVSSAPDLPPTEGDPLALERVFANLVHNALKFTPEAGCVTAKAAEQNGAIVVSVADTGPGIVPEVFPILFDKSRWVHSSGSVEGNGLGLFVVTALVEAHGGQVLVESTPDQGSCISVLLPVASAAQPQLGV